MNALAAAVIVFLTALAVGRFWWVPAQGNNLGNAQLWHRVLVAFRSRLINLLLWIGVALFLVWILAFVLNLALPAFDLMTIQSVDAYRASFVARFNFLLAPDVAIFFTSGLLLVSSLVAVRFEAKEAVQLSLRRLGMLFLSLQWISSKAAIAIAVLSVVQFSVTGSNWIGAPLSEARDAAEQEAIELDVAVQAMTAYVASTSLLESVLETVDEDEWEDFTSALNEFDKQVDNALDASINPSFATRDEGSTKALAGSLISSSMPEWKHANKGATSFKNSPPMSSHASSLTYRVPSNATRNIEYRSFTIAEIDRFRGRFGEALGRPLDRTMFPRSSELPRAVRGTFIDSAAKLFLNNSGLAQVRATLGAYPLTGALFDALTDSIVEEARKKYSDRLTDARRNSSGPSVSETRRRINLSGVTKSFPVARLARIAVEKAARMSEFATKIESEAKSRAPLRRTSPDRSLRDLLRDIQRPPKSTEPDGDCYCVGRFGRRYLGPAIGGDCTAYSAMCF